jgi:hypothetical protein
MELEAPRRPDCQVQRELVDQLLGLAQLVARHALEVAAAQELGRAVCATHYGGGPFARVRSGAI